MNQLERLAPALSLPALIASAAIARRRFLEFFAVTIRNPHTRRPAQHRPTWENLGPCTRRGAPGPLDVTTPVGRRDRMLIALMVYSFARIAAALGMPVEYVEKGLLCTS